MSDLAVIGGGVIGLSVAYEMSKRGAAVTVVEKPHPGAQASWAGAGILLPVCKETSIHPLEKLRSLSSDLHATWADELRELTGIDNGYSECGAVYFARSPGEIASLAGQMAEWTDNRIETDWLESSRLAQLIPVLSDEYADASRCKSAWLPGESQIRNPHQLQALRAGCEKHGVTFADADDVQLIHDSPKINGVKVRTSAGQAETIVADNYLIAAGSWSGQLVEPLGIRLPMVPVRGQMLLFKLEQQKFEPVIYEGVSYIVPRADGHVLAGSTTEEVGFNSTNTEVEVARLQAFAQRVIPQLSPETYLRAWAGLRPGTNDGFPYLGQLSPFGNCFVATGHFRWGLHLSTGTAVVMSDLIQGNPNEISLAPFNPARMNVAT